MASSAEKSGQSAETTFELPTEIWEQIFHHLDANQLLKARSICRRWKSIVDQKQSLMAKLTLTFPHEKALDENYRPEIPNLPIRSVNLSYISIEVTDAWWPNFGQNLMILKFNRCEVFLELLLGMLQHTPNLTKLTLESMGYIYLGCPAPNFRLDRLEELRVDESIFKHLITICPRLKRLYLPIAIIDEDIATMCNQMIKSVRTSLEELECNLSDHGISYLFGGRKEKVRPEPLFPNLKRLALYVDEEMIGSRNVLVKPYLDSMPQLQDLELHAPNIIDFYGLNIPNLRKLSLQEIHPHNLKSFITGAPNLRELKVEYGAITWWGDVFDVVDKIPTLRCLVVNSVESMSYTVCLKNVQPNNLEDLTLWSCHGFDAGLIKKFLKMSPRLRKIDLFDMDIDGEIIQAIGKNLPHLEKLELDLKQADVSGKSAKYIVDGCQKLNKIKIFNNKTFYEATRKLVEERQKSVTVEFEESICG